MAVPPDIMAALQGGAAPQGAGLPPDIMAALGGGGGQAPEAPPAPEDNVDALRQALDLIQTYIDGEDDEIHIQTALKCQTQLQGILAEEQKMQDGLLSGKMDPRALRKAEASSGAGY